MQLKRRHSHLPLALLVALCALPGAAQVPAGTKDVPSIARQAVRAVVLVVVYDAEGHVEGQGSGFVASSDGRVVTNHHVIRGAASAIAKFSDGGYYNLEGLLADDPELDIAVLKAKASGRDFPFLRLGDSGRVQLGDHVVAIGSPLALRLAREGITTEATVSDGIVSGFREEKSRNRKLIQTTAPISHGSSGGPLLNLSGEVIGVTTLAVNPAEGQNLNFAVPSEYVKALLADAPLRPFSESLAARGPGAHAGTLTDLEGTYVGVWESDRYGTSGVTALRVRLQGDVLRGDVTLTGSPVGFKGDVVLIKVRRFGEGVWAADFKGEHSSLSGTGIFKAGGFVGDFRFRWRLSVDRGRWILRKQ